MRDVTPVNCLKLLTCNSLQIFGSFPMPFGNFPATVALGFSTRLTYCWQPQVRTSWILLQMPRRSWPVKTLRFLCKFIPVHHILFALLLLNCSQADQLWDITSRPWMSKWLRLLHYSKCLNACSLLNMRNSSQFRCTYLGKLKIPVHSRSQGLAILTYWLAISVY